MASDGPVQLYQGQLAGNTDDVIRYVLKMYMPFYCAGFDQQQGNPQAMSKCSQVATMWMRAHEGSTEIHVGYCKRHGLAKLVKSTEEP